MSEPRRKITPCPEKSGALTATLIFAAVASLFIILATEFPQLYILATYEDLPGEWTQAFFFTATLITSLLLARKSHPYRLFFALLALACFYVVGEEISWGQRLFSFTSPEFFQRHNLQQEFNLHNFLTGPTATWQKRAIELGLVAALVGYGLLYPLLQRNGNRLARWFKEHGLPVPPLSLSPYFVTGALCELRLFSFNEAEIAELLIAMALAFLTLHHFLLTQEDRGRTPPWLEATAMVGVVLACLAGAGSVSWYCWTAPELHKQMAKRITAGQKKFGQRYYRYGDWQNSAILYKALLVKTPEDRVLLRSLASTYKEMGDEQSFLSTNVKAIRLDMIQYGRNPRQIAVNLSLFESFQQNGRQEKARLHLTRAMEESRNKVLLEPYNAGSFYWYGKCLQAKGETNAAKEQFARAVSMKPTSKRYLQAYRKSLHELNNS
ncbi:MAG: hypothetical protein KJ804_00190 [Proteobacteria bacterium]|nr:hypothetical protein [Pseudomonadota bacterium]MBU1056725.1 hypothetical protein [Pseudomonadota bacterium]